MIRLILYGYSSNTCLSGFNESSCFIASSSSLKITFNFCFKSFVRSYLFFPIYIVNQLLSNRSHSSCLICTSLHGSIPDRIPTDPTIYRFCEIAQVYGSTLKTLVMSNLEIVLLVLLTLNWLLRRTLILTVASLQSSRLTASIFQPSHFESLHNYFE